MQEGIGRSCWTKMTQNLWYITIHMHIYFTCRNQGNKCVYITIYMTQLDRDALYILVALIYSTISEYSHGIAQKLMRKTWEELFNVSQHGINHLVLYKSSPLPLLQFFSEHGNRTCNRLTRHNKAQFCQPSREGLFLCIHPVHSNRTISLIWQVSTAHLSS